MHQRPMVSSPTEPDCSTTVTPSFSKSARRPRLCAASRGASPAGPPPIIATPVRPRLKVTCFGVAKLAGHASKSFRGGIVEVGYPRAAAHLNHSSDVRQVSQREAYDRRCLKAKHLSASKMGKCLSKSKVFAQSKATL